MDSLHYINCIIMEKIACVYEAVIYVDGKYV